ncbi:MAG: hypothetical protein E6G41_16505 [Actinobacteria bacterium]|nr:MAG: hypothetical protein E6G41_16505 [Actinomycetota bacterium]
MIANRESTPWWCYALTGVLSAAAGIAVLVWPDITLLALAIITGINILLLSALLIGETLGSKDDASKTLRVVVGVAGVIAGVIVIRHPEGTLLAIVLAVGVWLILSGLAELMGAIAMGGERRMLRFLGAAGDIVIGILILALPKLSLTTVAVLIGIGFIIRGLVLLAGGWRLRGERAGSEPAATPA